MLPALVSCGIGARSVVGLGLLPLVPVHLCEGVFLFETIDLRRSRDLSERPSLRLMRL